MSDILDELAFMQFLKVVNGYRDPRPSVMVAMLPSPRSSSRTPSSSAGSATSSAMTIGGALTPMRPRCLLSKRGMAWVNPRVGIAIRCPAGVGRTVTC
jgi:hypothetical protein